MAEASAKRFTIEELRKRLRYKPIPGVFGSQVQQFQPDHPIIEDYQPAVGGQEDILDRCFRTDRDGYVEDNRLLINLSSQEAPA